MEELISIITPVYNSERFIEETIKSVINQNYKHWEWLIVDDCSEDSSENIIKKYSEIDSRIKYIKLERNRGPGGARNYGIKMAAGNYIAFIDSDDIWSQEKLKIQLEFMKNNRYDFTFTNYSLIDEMGADIKKIRRVKKMISYEELLKGNIIGCSTVMINKENIRLIEMPIVKHEDFATWLNILKENNLNAYGIEKELTQYRIVKGSVSHNKFKCIKFTWDIYRKSQNIAVGRSIYLIINYMKNAILKRM